MTLHASRHSVHLLAVPLFHLDSPVNKKQNAKLEIENTNYTLDASTPPSLSGRSGDIAPPSVFGVTKATADDDVWTSSTTSLLIGFISTPAFPDRTGDVITSFLPSQSYGNEYFGCPNDPTGSRFNED